MYNVRGVSRRTSNFANNCRRRTDDTRRVLLVITVECLFAIFNSWFSDTVLSLISCKKKLLVDDDCPRFLEQNYDLMIIFDLLNSVSNIVLHCLSGKHFRQELFFMFVSMCRSMRLFSQRILCCRNKSSPDIQQYKSCIYYRTSVSRNGSVSPNASQLNVMKKSLMTR